MTESFQFVHPEFLLLLLVLPLLAIWKGRWGSPVALRLPSTDDAVLVGARPRTKIGGFLAFLGLLSLALLIVAFARPRYGKGSTDVEASGIDIVLTLDVSGSMEALDFELEGKPVNRLEVVKNVVAKFIGQRPNDKLGMVAFAGRPYLVSPLTLDHEFLGKRLAGVKMGQVEDGTAIGSAIASAVSHLKDSTAKSRIIILLTDGVNNAGAVNPLTAAEAAKALGIKVYTIGAGIRGDAPVPVQDAFGRTHLQTMKVEIDEEMLREVANATGGQAFRATDTDSLGKIYDSINQLEKTTRKLKKYQQYDELYLYFLLPGLFLLLLELILVQTRFRRLP
ncbi:MAG: VWA domain-containing protein [Akkermansiaceae bacterium]|nr:VWA domain-containing protein [Akkermansiaceae bacterium]MBJ7394577.1 VWA domain-containing protein [Akkermansiaceae bacterium]MBJ7424004.1 VWA domain-containing protein [Akkermansiaceae bacterium]